MKYLFVVSAVFCFAVAGANVVVTELETNAVRQEAEGASTPGISINVPEVPEVVPTVTEAPAGKCPNVTVDTKDCGSVIVTRLPFLFNFRHLSGICNCEDGQLKCDRGAGSSFFQRFQIPGLRLVYNANCKCKCPSAYVADIMEPAVVDAAVEGNTVV